MTTETLHEVINGGGLVVVAFLVGVFMWKFPRWLNERDEANRAERKMFVETIKSISEKAETALNRNTEAIDKLESAVDKLEARINQHDEMLRRGG